MSDVDVATAGQLPLPNTFHYGGVAAGGVSKTTLKRKIPSELRVTFLSLDLAMSFLNEFCHKTVTLFPLKIMSFYAMLDFLDALFSIRCFTVTGGGALEVH